MAETTSVKGKETGGMKAKRNILTVFSTALFAVLSFLIVYPLFAGLIASFRPGTELIRRGLHPRKPRLHAAFSLCLPFVPHFLQFPPKLRQPLFQHTPVQFQLRLTGAPAAHGTAGTALTG